MRGLILVLCMGVLTSCAGYCIHDEALGKKGYVVYEPWPHVLQTAAADKSGTLTGYTFEIVYLPNRARPFRITSWSGLGKADFKFDFTDGWMLTGFHDKGDNTEVLKALTGLLPEVPGIESAGAPLPLPVLYRVEFDTCGRVCGLTPIRRSESARHCEVSADCCPTRSTVVSAPGP